ncbi:hypothetical protein KIN20_004824 [Parelaphostrongylus tenuis]|uniref:Uncharacterized protein n=1 Tax=Parelaphostrongylus tenuis TaxID=148309 RepID=A0AAD5M197_PARTN|nr:hypothetical protein KIN20_004824 [Parelaphostrongylus tenuis]
MPAGQMSTRSFKVTGFSLPVNMVYTGKPEVVARVSGIASSEAVARGFVERLVMQTARSALLPDPIISTILGQLYVTVIYTPMMCQDVLLGLGDNTRALSI